MEEKIVELNNPQVDAALVNANKTYVMIGRAGGKTNGIEGPHFIKLTEKMPRSQIGLVVPNYEMGHDKILSNLQGFWENEMGLVEGEDFVICKKPPDEWERPIIPINNFKHVISFASGCAVCMVSLAVEGSANGYNLQALIGDEAKFFNEKKLKEVRRALRGGHKQFGHLPEFQSEWYFTDKFEGDIEWMLNKRKLMDKKLIASVIALQLKVNDLEEEAESCHPELVEGLLSQAQLLTDKLNVIRKDLVYVCEASAEENRGILGDKFFDDLKADSTEIEYNVAILNKDPDKTENSFYPKFGDHNLYALTHDVDFDKPLIIACDYQWRISPVVTAQYSVLPGAKDVSLNFIYDCHELHPNGLKEAIVKWCDHFRNYPTRIVYYLYDKTATNKSPVAKPYYEVVTEELRSQGWSVIEEHMGEPPLHDTKFKNLNDHISVDSTGIKVMVNKITCDDMKTSINLTPATKKNGKTAKDKRQEGNLSYPAVKAPHFSDVFDMILVGCLEMNLVPQGVGDASFSTIYSS